MITSLVKYKEQHRLIFIALINGIKVGLFSRILWVPLYR